MKRRRFIQAIAVAPAVPALTAQQTPTVPATAGTRPAGRGTQTAPALPPTAPDVVAEPVRVFFNAGQFAALQKLGSLMMPPLKGNPGAIDAGGPEFLDFLIGVSPADSQKLYRNGLDSLNAQAKKQFSKPFADLDAKQADAILRPLLVTIAWDEDLPTDPLKHFIAQVHRDLRTATVNSREWANAGAGSGRRGGRGGFGGGVGQYLNPVDPV